MKRVLGIAIITAAVFSASIVYGASPATGTGILLSYDTIYTGTSPVGAGPWVTAAFQDVGPGTVQLTISSVNLLSGEKLGALYLNLNPAYNVNSLHFSLLNGTPSVGAPLPSLGEDAFRAGGGSQYDIFFRFSEPPSSAFGAGDFLTYQITGVPTLTATDFGFLSSDAGGQGPFYSAIHVQGIPNGAGSGWLSPSTLVVLPVPEPTSGALLLLAAAGLGLRRWRRAAKG